jgi:hypothetical protein
MWCVRARQSLVLWLVAVTGCGSGGHPRADAAADHPRADAAADAPAEVAADAAAEVTPDASDASEDLVPDLSQNPPIPAGWQLLPQSQVTAEMTAWAVMILDDPATYPMFSTATMTFGGLTIMARVEWQPPDFQNGQIHRGVTLYEPVAN